MLKWRLRARSRVQCSERELLRAVVLRFSAQNRVLCSEPTVVCGANNWSFEACCMLYCCDSVPRDAGCAQYNI